MDKTVAHRILDLQERFRACPEYGDLVKEQDVLSSRFLEAAEAMTQAQRDAVFDYVGFLLELHLRTLEYAVS